MNAEVNYATLAMIAAKLDSAAHTVNDCGTTAPSHVDAAELSGALLKMVAAALTSAAGVAEGLAEAASKVREAAANCVAADDAAAEAFARLGR
ncbi:MAG: hypothetical protein ACT4PP_02015 [Sporichthyaceae bacterium]